MSQKKKTMNSDGQSKKINEQQIYNNSVLTRKIFIPIRNINNNMISLLKKEVLSQIEGRCIVEGYVKPSSVNIISYSSGLINADYITFNVLFECMICMPSEGMHIKCIVKNVTKAGVKAETNESPNPLVIFIARDHHYNIPSFSKIQENDEIMIKIIGQRFELNDKYISIIAELIDTT
jgi:DNA-directed RNA polymerase subunit E'/Rpb7